MDLAASSALGAATVAGAAAWAARGRGTRATRVDQAGSSVLLGPSVQHAAYWVAAPLGQLLANVGLSANAITLASIPLAAGATLAFAGQHWGVGALLAALSYACDALDGLVARATGTASGAGEVLDAVCDRISETVMLSGVAIAWRSSVPLLGLALLAVFGAQQVTLASAKAEIFPGTRGRVPRGVMRRAERAVYFIGATALAGALQDLAPAAYAAAAAQLPVVLAMGLIGVLGNVSALYRFAALARALRGRAEEAGHAGR